MFGGMPLEDDIEYLTKPTPKPHATEDQETSK